MPLMTPKPRALIDGAMHMILSMIGNGRSLRVHRPGVIEISHFSAEQEWAVGPWYELDKLHPVFGYGAEGHIPEIAVVDSIEQWEALFTERLNAIDIPVAAFFTHIPKDPENKGRGGGWRWRKWGQYLGEGDPQHEYLDDEDGFEDGVWVVHLHPVLDAVEPEAQRHGDVIPQGFTAETYAELFE